MKYYATLGHVRATLIPRYFVSDDEEVRRGVLDDLRKEMGIIVWHIPHFPIELLSNAHHQLVEPLSFEPGTDWAYGQGVDWAGQLGNSPLSSL
jgi:hypothetical protein